MKTPMQFLNNMAQARFKNKVLCYFIGKNGRILARFIPNSARYVVFNNKIYPLKHENEYLMEFTPMPRFMPMLIPSYQFPVEYVDDRTWYRKLWDAIPNLAEDFNKVEKK